jgi:hypothetical protein
MNSFLEKCEDYEFETWESVVFYASTSIFFIVTGLPCIKLIFDKNPSTKNISIIPGLSSYFLVALYLGYHIFIDDKNPYKIILDIFQLFFILVWNCIYLWHSSLKHILKMLNKCLLLLGVGVDTVFIGFLLKENQEKMLIINILKFLPNSLMFFLTFQCDIWRRRRYEYINIWSSICGMVHAALCIVMLSIKNDCWKCQIFILIPNIIGFIVCLIYMIIYCKLKNRQNYEHAKIEY